MRRIESRYETPACHDKSLGAEELNWPLQNNDKKGIRRCKEVFICDLK
jgi:hypothetical protein